MSQSDVTAYIAAAPAWGAEMDAASRILLGAGLDMEIKWRKPCFLHEGRNIAILQPMKDFLALLFFKGALIDDPDGLLESQGPNSRSSKRVCFRQDGDAERMAGAIQALARSAIAVEVAGLSVPGGDELVLPAELAEALAADPELSDAFDALTPGRQRGYVIHVNGAKQATTRFSRIAKCRDKIMAGKGFQDR